MTICVCGKETSNPFFCCPSCANKNRKYRTHLVKNCETCGTSFTYKERVCPTCKEKRKQDRENKKYTTLAELAEFYQKTGVHRSWWYSEIRHYALLWNKDKRTCCAACGYTNHVELCHVKSIAEFPMTATLAEINARENIVGLCPNHHWELDHDLLTLDPEWLK
jgi:hypothetical protein